MANSLLAQELNEHYKNNLERFVKEHPGKFVLIEQYGIESFYQNQEELKKAIQEKYGDSMSYTIISKQIPKEIPKREDKI